MFSSLKQRLLSLDYNARLYLCNCAAQVPFFHFRHGVYHRVGRLQIGSRASIHRGLRLFCLGGVEIGQGSIINGECWLDGRRGLTIGKHVSISIGCRLLTLGHDAQSPDFAPQGAPIVVEDYAWLGAFATILPGVRIGRGAVVGAGSLVTKDVSPLTIVAGNPARPIGQRQAELNYELDHRPWFF